MALDLLASLEHVEVAAHFGIVVQARWKDTAAEDEVEKQQHRVDGDRPEESPFLAILFKPGEDQSSDNRSSDGSEA